MEQPQIDVNELLASLRESIGLLIQENLTLKLTVAKLMLGDKPQQ